MDGIKLIQEPISRQMLKTIALERLGDMVKAVVDVDKEIMAVGGEMHADEESWLLEKGSSQSALWGINLYPDADVTQMIEYDSLINIRPSQGNRSRSIEDEALRHKITRIVNKLITD